MTAGCIHYPGTRINLKPKYLLVDQREITRGWVTLIVDCRVIARSFCSTSPTKRRERQPGTLAGLQGV